MVTLNILKLQYRYIIIEKKNKKIVFYKLLVFKHSNLYLCIFIDKKSSYNYNYLYVPVLLNIWY